MQGGMKGGKKGEPVGCTHSSMCTTKLYTYHCGRGKRVKRPCEHSISILPGTIRVNHYSSLAPLPLTHSQPRITDGKVPCPLVGSLGFGGKPPSYAVGRVHGTRKNSLEMFIIIIILSSSPVSPTCALRRHGQRKLTIRRCAAATVHDLAHRGLTNDFLISSRDPAAIMYNDRCAKVNKNKNEAQALYDPALSKLPLL
eukprot:1186959-Prorocentrum_minimum.AAC.1